MMLTIFDYISIFLVSFLVYTQLFHRKKQQNSLVMDRRLAEHINANLKDIKVSDSNQKNSIINQMLVLFRQKDKMDQLLESSNSNWTAEQVGSYQLGVSLLLLTILPRLGYNMIFIIIVMLIVASVPNFILKRKYQKRKKMFSSQLSKGIRTISTAMRVGYSFKQAFQKVAEDFPDPLGVEFQKAVKEMNYGVDLSTALNNIYARIPNDDFRVFKSTVLLQRQTGGNLTEVLEILDEVIVGRIKLKQEADTLTSQGRISGYVVTGLPVGVFLILNVINHEYMSLLYTTTFGYVILGISITMLTLGWLMIKKIVTIV